MKQYLDISTLDGKTLPPVDCITFGSPCTNLSVAGKREGLEGAQSILFYEAVRIIQEMREKTDGMYPRFAVWENVTGAFSSHGGKDFAQVLHSLVTVAEPEAPHLPVPDEGWATVGQLRGDLGRGWSVAWRTFNAQYWGTPQRRRRILLVADFTAGSASEILFDTQSLPRDFETLPTEREDFAQNVANCTGRTGESTLSFHLTQDTISAEEVAPCLSCGSPHGQATVGVCYNICSFASNSMRSDNPNSGIYKADTSRTLDKQGGNPSCHQGGTMVLFENHARDARYKEREVCPTLKASCGTGGGNVPFVLSVDTSHADDVARVDNIAPSLQARDYKGGKNVVYAIDRGSFHSSENFHHTPSITEDGVCSTLLASGPSAVATVQPPNTKYRVRRLTPTECARLQGFPDWWADVPQIQEMSKEDYLFWGEVLENWANIQGTAYKPKTKKQMTAWYNKLHTDSAEYKMWGNGVALPMVRYVMAGVAQQGAKTMGSLFDGSGGFPLASCLQGITPLWSSEIEPYPIAVTRARFGKEAIL